MTESLVDDSYRIGFPYTLTLKSITVKFDISKFYVAVCLETTDDLFVGTYV
jgi:hypothetical protein